MDIQFVFAAILALVYAVSIDIEALTLIPQEKWFSFTGGVTVAYVVLDILPRLKHSPSPVTPDTNLITVDITTYCVMLLGILLMYGLEQWAQRSRRFRKNQMGIDQTSSMVFAAHIAAFSLYVLLLTLLLFGYRFDSFLIERSLLFTVLILHSIVVTHRLIEHHRRAYQRIGRWIVVAVLLLSSTLSALALRTILPFNYIWAFVGGGLLVFGLQDERRPDYESCFWSFGFGAVVFSVVLILL
jgi:hypothetical protein